MKKSLFNHPRFVTYGIRVFAFSKLTDKWLITDNCTAGKSAKNYFWV